MAKHTPGPWLGYSSADQNPNEIPHVLHLAPKLWEPSWPIIENEKIAEIIVDSETQRANAALIAAAPEMLEALKSIQDTFLKGGDQITSEMMEKVNAAIKKAEGRDND